MAAELDYAFVAQYARINPDETLTVLNASFLRLGAISGTPIEIAVAGRIRFTEAPYHAALGVVFTAPGGAKLRLTTQIEAREETSYGDGRRHALFAVNTAPVASVGVYWVTITLDDRLVRELAFELVQPQA